MKNLKKFIATILATTLAFGCIGSVSTFGTEEFFLGDGTETFNPNLSQDRFNILDSIEKTGFTEGKIAILTEFFQNFSDNVHRKTGMYPPAPTDFDINDQRIRNATRDIIKKFIDIDPFLLNRLLSNCRDKLAFLKIIYDFQKSKNFPSEDKVLLYNFFGEQTLFLINGFYGTYVKY